MNLRPWEKNEAISLDYSIYFNSMSLEEEFNQTEVLNQNSCHGRESLSLIPHTPTHDNENTESEKN